MLEPDLLLTAYRHGIFPMAVNKRGEIGWFSPDPRAVIPLDERFHVPHGLRRALKKKKFEITIDSDFESVIRACAKRKEGTWISKMIMESYCEMHRLGHAHSVEVWLPPKTEIAADDSGVSQTRLPRQSAFAKATADKARNDKMGKLVGGLYGVHLGGAFFGESMFHRATDASKVALVWLVERLRHRGFVLLDTQWLTPHLKQFGTYEIPRHDYLWRLEHALKLSCKF
jgi:leucyl/phenylalanyl-tRNA--protein transferase